MALSECAAHNSPPHLSRHTIDKVRRKSVSVDRKWKFGHPLREPQCRDDNLVDNDPDCRAEWQTGADGHGRQPFRHRAVNPARSYAHHIMTHSPGLLLLGLRQSAMKDYFREDVRDPYRRIIALLFVGTPLPIPPAAA